MSRSMADVPSVSGSQHRVGSEPALETLLSAQLSECPRGSRSWRSQRSSAIKRLGRANAKPRCNNARKPEARHAFARSTHQGGNDVRVKKVDTEAGMLSGISRKRNMRSSSCRFTEFCNSQCLSHFAAPFIVARTETFIAGSCVFCLEKRLLEKLCNSCGEQQATATRKTKSARTATLKNFCGATDAHPWKHSQKHSQGLEDDEGPSKKSHAGTQSIFQSALAHARVQEQATACNLGTARGVCE